MNSIPIKLYFFYLLLLLLYNVNLFAYKNTIYITKQIGSTNSYADYNGDNQSFEIGKKVLYPLRIKVYKGNYIPVANMPVKFTLVSSPQNSVGFSFDSTVAYTDSLGIASTYVTLGLSQGEYVVSAKIYDSEQNTQSVLFRLYAQKPNWTWFMIIALIGGLGLFLFGIKLITEGMQKSSGHKMRSILGTLTKNRMVALGVGVFITIILQSSSITSSLLITCVQAGLISFANTIPVILGGFVGGTITTQIIAFRLTDYAPLLIGIGILLMFIKKSETYGYVGHVVFGFGLLFFGMAAMSQAIEPLRHQRFFMDGLSHLSNPYFALLAGICCTAVFQNSSAFIGILIVLASQGMLSLSISVPMVLGSNVATAITPIMASLHGKREAKKVALAHTLLKIFGVILVWFWMDRFIDVVSYFSPAQSSIQDSSQYIATILPRQIANAHTIYNLLLAIIALPLTNVFEKIIHHIFPILPEPDEVPFKIKYLDDKLIETPALALNAAKLESIRMLFKVHNMVRDILPVFIEQNKDLITKIQNKECEVDFLKDEIISYLLKISRDNVNEQRVNEAFQIMYTIKEFEQIADIVATNLLHKAEDFIEKKLEFSEEGKKEIIAFHTLTLEQVNGAIEVFRDVNLEKAKELKKNFKKYLNEAVNLEKHHYDRLIEQVHKTLTSSKTHLEIIGLLNAVTRHAANTSRMLLEWTDNK